MKKILFFMALIAISTAEAQTFGVKGGLNLSNVDNLYEAAANPKMKPGVNIGGFVNLPINDQIMIQPELLYSSKGLRYRYGTDELSYISLPIMVQYSIIPGLYIEGGPEASLLLSAKDKYKGDAYDEPGTENYTDELKKIDFGIGIGLGYDITDVFGVNGRYVLGIVDIWKEKMTGYESKNSVLQIGVSYKFLR